MKTFTLFNPDAVVKEIDVVINSSLDYEKVIKNVKYIKSKRIKIPVAGIKDLVKMKKNTKREQDISDARYLKKLLEYEKGFSYYLEEEKIKEHRKWSAEEKLRWLSYGNRLREFYPKKVIKIQEKFRKREI